MKPKRSRKHSTVRILVANDDGIHSKGIHVLAEALRELGEVYVVAPDRERNAAGHSLTLHKPLRVHEFSEKTYAINGTPTDCINLGLRLMKHRPSLVISGINQGENLGDDVTYSGTVSAAMEGTLLGFPAFAISMVGDPPYHFETAAAFAQRLAKRILLHGLPSGVLLNVNVPNLSPEGIQGVRVTRLGQRKYKDVIVEKVDPRGRKYYWIAGSRIIFDGEKDTDFKAIQSRCISITPLKLDLTDRQSLKKLKPWEKALL